MEAFYIPNRTKPINLRVSLTLRDLVTKAAARAPAHKINTPQNKPIFFARVIEEKT